MGLKVGTVSLENYNSQWKEEFSKEKENLIIMFGDIALSVEHVGSTSIEGLSAKPIIDISIGIKNLNDFEKVKTKFTENAEYSVKEDSLSNEVLIRKGPEDNRTHFIHVMEIESPRYRNTIEFRDYLRSNPSELKKYEDLKYELAEKYPNDRKMYTSSKNDFIVSILEKINN